MRNLHIFYVMVLIAGCLGSCKDKDKTLDEAIGPLPNTSVFTVLTSDPKYSTFVLALKKAGLDASLQGRFNATVFAPTNDAFTAARIVVADVPASDLKTILDYHIVRENQLSANLKPGILYPGPATGGNRLFISKIANDLYLNGVAKITQADAPADNGLIHTIDAVLIPASQTSVQIINADSTNFIYLKTALEYVNTSKNAQGRAYGILGAIEKDSLTIFAPDNKAFINTLSLPAGGDTASVKKAKALIRAIPAETLFKILNYHILPKRFAFSTDLTSGSLTMLSKDVVSVTVGGTPGPNPTAGLLDESGNPANVTRFNVLSKNAVIHVINRVLLPQ
jgi:uncharacterized surface protein with fasciclin (FAS1) repeats